MKRALVLTLSIALLLTTASCKITHVPVGNQENDDTVLGVTQEQQAPEPPPVESTEMPHEKKQDEAEIPEMPPPQTLAERQSFGVKYGENATASGEMISLEMDIFLPEAGVGSFPLLILFGRTPQDRSVPGDGLPPMNNLHWPKYDAEFAIGLSELGIAVACIDTDKEMHASEDSQNITAEWRIAKAVQNASIAMQFFHDNAAIYGIDIERIYLGGHSVMATLSGYTVYWDKIIKIEQNFAQTMEDIGGFDASPIAGWVFLAGCFPTDYKTIVESSPSPMLFIYPTNDETLPIGQSTYTMAQMNRSWYGGESLYEISHSAGNGETKVFVLNNGKHYDVIEPRHENIGDIYQAIANFIRK